MFRGLVRLGSNQRLFSSFGLIGPVSFTSVLVAVSLANPGYSHVTQYISELGQPGASLSWAMNILGFGLLGLLTLGFSWALYKGFGRNLGLRSGSSLLGLSGVFLIMVGIFPRSPGSLIGLVHGGVSITSALVAVLGLLLISWGLFRLGRFKRMGAYTLITALASLLIWIIFFFNPVDGMTGALQRLSMGLTLLWMGVLGIRLFRTQAYSESRSV
jgi:hypothetical membrane protein